MCLCIRSAKEICETWRPKIRDNLHSLFDVAGKEVENPPFFDIFSAKDKDFIGCTQALAEEEMPLSLLWAVHKHTLKTPLKQEP